jgi:hypothetical protein
MKTMDDKPTIPKGDDNKMKNYANTMVDGTELGECTVEELRHLIGTCRYYIALIQGLARLGCSPAELAALDDDKARP